MKELELLKSGGYCFCVKCFSNDEKIVIENYLKENSYKVTNGSSALPKDNCYYINYDTKYYTNGIIGIMVLKPIGRCIITVDEFLLIVSIFDKKQKVW